MIDISTNVNIGRALALALALACGSALLSASSAVAQPAATPPAVAWEPFTFDVRGVGNIPAQVGRIRVPERRSNPDSRTIEIGFVRLASKTPRQAPLVYLDGGPGGDGYGIARVAAYYRLFDRARADRDVILLSQRSVGLSRPRLACPGPNRLPDDFFTSDETMQRAFEAPLRACAEQLRRDGADLAAYNTREMADDVEDLRRAPGVPRVSLLGFSYGTHLGLEILRRHPGSIDRAVFIGTEGPSHTLKLPRVWDEQFNRLAAAARGVVPDLGAAWRSLLASATNAPLDLTVEIGGTPRTIKLGPAAIRWIIRRDLGDTNDWPWMPITIAGAARGNLEGFRRAVPRRWAQLDAGIGLMAFAVDCASGVPADRLERIREQEAGSILGSMTNFPYPAICQFLGVPALPDDFRAPVVSDVPTLFISGTNDANTPPAQAEEVRRTFARSTHLVVEHAGHESSMPHPPVQDAILRFLDGGTVEGLALSVPLQPFIGR